MKKLLVAGTALIALLGTAASAQPYSGGHDRDGGQYGQDRHDGDRGQYGKERRDADRGQYGRGDDRRDVREARAEHRWARGQRLPREYWGPQYYVTDYGRYGLRAPPRGYRWYRQGNDYVMAAAATGLIASVIAASR